MFYLCVLLHRYPYASENEAEDKVQILLEKLLTQVKNSLTEETIVFPYLGCLKSVDKHGYSSFRCP